MSLTYKVSIDWLNDGDFVDAGDDVTKRVLARSALTVAFGRDQARALAQTAVGRARTTHRKMPHRRWRVIWRPASRFSSRRP